MIRPEFKKLLLDQRGAAVILWSAFFICVPIYIVIARSLATDPRIGARPGFADPARMVLWALVVIDLGYYIYWRKRNFSPAAMLRSARATKLLRALEEFRGVIEERAAYVVSTYITRKVVLFAIIEAIAVYGLVLALVGHFRADFYLLSGITLVLLAIEFPSAKSLDARVRAVEQGETAEVDKV